MDQLTLLDSALVPLIMGITQVIKKYFPKRFRDFIPAILAFVLIIPAIIISLQELPPLPLFLSLWLIEGLKTAGAAELLYKTNKGSKARRRSNQ